MSHNVAEYFLYRQYTLLKKDRAIVLYAICTLLANRGYNWRRNTFCGVANGYQIDQKCSRYG